MCNLYISDFYICDLRSGQFRDLSIISLWGNLEMRTASTKRAESTTSLSELTHKPICNDHSSIDAPGSRKGHLSSLRL